MSDDKVSVKEALGKLYNLSWMIGSTSVEYLTDKDGEKIRDYIGVIEDRIDDLENELSEFKKLSPEVRASIAEKLGCGFYACPSSIHEMVIIPNKDDVLDLDDLGEMVRDINAEYVSEEEILSDKVIKCDNCGNIIG